MAIVTSYDLENDTWTYHNDDHASRMAWRQAVTEIAEKAKAALPEAESRIAKAVQLVLSGDVTLLENGSKARVASQSNGNIEYFVVNGECQCKDFPKAPANFCKHRLAYGIYKRVSALMKQRLEVQGENTLSDSVSSVESEALVETPTTINIPAQFLTEIHGKQFVQYAGLLAMAHERGLVNLSASFISVDKDLALAKATAEFADGKIFKECGDATPANVHPKVKPHFPRMALTRAKARCLRDALNISVCSVEEMEV